MITVNRTETPARVRLQACQLTKGQLYRAFDGNGEYAGIVLATSEDPLFLSCDGVMKHRPSELGFVKNPIFRFEIANDVTVCVGNPDV